MKKLNSLGTAFEGLLFILFGIVILIWPKIATNIIFNFAGILLIIVSIISLILIFRNKEFKSTQWFLGIQGVLSLVFGLVLLIGNSVIFTLILSYILIIWFLIMAIGRLIFIIQFKVVSNFRIVSIILNLTIIGISIWAMLNAQVAFTLFIWMIALILLSRGVENIALAFLVAKNKEQ